MQVEKSEELKYLLHFYTRETTFGDKKYDNCRLKLMVQRHLGQKKKREIETRTGLQWEIQAKAKGKYNAQNNSERGDCIRWTTKDKCSFGDACAFKHDPNNKGKGKDDFVHYSDAEISKGDGKCGDD